MNAAHICIRELRPDDSVTAITELLHAAYAPLAAMGFKYLATHQDEATTRRRLQSGISLVAELDGDIVGTVTLRAPKAESRCAWYLQPGVWSFGQFAVRPALQRHGLGRRLMREIEQRALQRGAEELALDTAEGATHLVRWYERLGFRFIQHVSWEETNYRSVVMSKRLTSAFDVNARIPPARICIATERDARAISALIRRNADAVLAEEYSSAQLAAWKRYNTPARFRERMKSRTTFGAYRTGRLCGTIALDGAELVGFYVSPSCRGQGIGKLLLTRLEAFAISQGIQSLSLTSSPSATTFYLQHGWKTRRSVVLSMLGVDFEETLMTKQLPHITHATTSEEIAAIRSLFEEYAAWLRIDLSYQGFAAELAMLPGCYAAPRGCLLLATIDDQPAGCVALRPIDERTCEMKRLFVRARFHGRGLGRALAQRVIAEARDEGYTTMVLDTLPFMQSAIRLYEALEFKRRAAYYDSPLPETVFMELQLGETCR